MALISGTDLVLPVASMSSLISVTSDNVVVWYIVLNTFEMCSDTDTYLDIWFKEIRMAALFYM